VTGVKPGRAAAAEMPLGLRAAQAGVGLCSSCRHPVRLHGDVGCTTGECWCNATGADLRAGVTTTAALAVPPSAAEMALLDALCTCGHVRTEHKVSGSHVQCKVCRCGGFTPEGPDAPVAPPVEPAPPPAAAAPAPAVASAAAAGPVGEQPAPPPLTVDEIVAAGKAAPYRRPRLRTARPAASALGVERAAVGGPDAVEEVAAVPPPAATAGRAGPSAMYLSVLDTAAELLAGREPEPLDLTPFLGAALYYYPAWFCRCCLQRRHNPGVHCRRPLLPVYVVIASRETS
jgi:hypothetical protein